MNGDIRAIDAACSVCGGTVFTKKKVLWQALIDEWQIAPDEAAYIDEQQGKCCIACGSNLRSLALADAFLAFFRWKGTLKDYAASNADTAPAVLEINEAGTLHTTLIDLPGHLFAPYPEIDIHALPYGDASFEAVLHSDTLEHVQDPVHALAECLRVLKSGGALFFTVPIIVGRLSRSRDGLPPSYHGNAKEGRDDWLVRTEFGADFWTFVMRAGFDRMTLAARDFPAAVAITAYKA